MRQFCFLQLQLTLLDDLKKFQTLKDGELWGDLRPLLENPLLQLHVAVWHQLTHNLLALDL